MEDDDKSKGEKGVEATAEELGTADEDDDRVVGDGDDGGDEEDHEVAKDFEARAEPEEVDLHLKWEAVNLDLGDDWPSGSWSSRE